MALSGKNPQAEAQSQSLPLFRPDVVTAQEKPHGDSPACSLHAKLARLGYENKTKMWKGEMYAKQ